MGDPNKMRFGLNFAEPVAPNRLPEGVRQIANSGTRRLPSAVGNSDRAGQQAACSTHSSRAHRRSSTGRCYAQEQHPLIVSRVDAIESGTSKGAGGSFCASLLRVTAESRLFARTRAQLGVGRLMDRLGSSGPNSSGWRAVYIACSCDGRTDEARPFGSASAGKLAIGSGKIPRTRQAKSK